MTCGQVQRRVKSLARDDVVSYLKKKKRKKKYTCVRMKLEKVWGRRELIETINRLFRGFLVSPSIRTTVCSLPEAILNSTLDVYRFFFLYIHIHIHLYIYIFFFYRRVREVCTYIFISFLFGHSIVSSPSASSNRVSLPLVRA